MPADHVFLLTGFSMVMSNGDFPIRAIEIMPMGDQGVVMLTLDNGLPVSQIVTLQCVAVPRSRVVSQTYCTRTECFKKKPDQSTLALQEFSCWKGANRSSFVLTIGATPANNDGSTFRDNRGKGQCNTLFAELRQARPAPACLQFISGAGRS